MSDQLRTQMLCHQHSGCVKKVEGVSKKLLPIKPDRVYVGKGADVVKKTTQN